jgi:hypothetical protein
VLAGQLFVPSLESLLAIDPDFTGHVALFHENDRGFIDGVSGLLAAALRRGDSVSLVSSSRLRAGVAQRLQAAGWSVGESGDYGPYRAADSAAALAPVIRNGSIDLDRLRELVAETDGMRVNGARGAQSISTFVGDVSTHLLEPSPQLALDLERAWTELTHTLRFVTVCCYPTSRFEAADGRLFPQLCDEHMAVAHTPEGRSRSLRM